MSDTGGGIKSAIIDFVAGCFGGIALVYVGQPFDTIKVKMQTFPTVYKGMVECFKTTLAKDGIARGLYAGTVPALVANITENAVLFTGYGFAQNLIMSLTNRTNEELTILDYAASGFFGGFGASLALCPTELVKCKLQALREMEKINSTQNIARIGPFELTKQILQTDGVPGMFKGLTATIAREMPGYFFFFGAYEATREFFREPGQPKENIGPLKTMIAGSLGGIAFWLAIFPADVIKSRVQITGINPGFLNVTMSITKNEGFLALYNGLLPTIVRCVPACGALFVVVEYSKKIMYSIF